MRVSCLFVLLLAMLRSEEQKKAAAAAAEEEKAITIAKLKQKAVHGPSPALGKPSAKRALATEDEGHETDCSKSTGSGADGAGDTDGFLVPTKKTRKQSKASLPRIVKQ